MIKLWCMCLFLYVVSISGEPHYIQGELILQVRQKVARRPSSCGCNSCPKQTKVACRYLGGSCISCSKSCNGETISGSQYCGGHCNCCVPHTTWMTTATSLIDDATTAPPPPAPLRRPRRSGCSGSYDGLEYTGLCKLDCEATGMVDTYDHDCANARSVGSSYKCCIEKPLAHCNISGTPYKSGKRFRNKCMMFECDNGTLTSEFTYNEECGQCYGRNDPHFKNFDDVLFDWHGQTDVLMVQQGKEEEECPDHYVGQSLVSCTPPNTWATCVGTVFYQTPSGVQISVPNVFKLIVDGVEQEKIKEKEITILKGADGNEVPVIAFRKDFCLHLQGVENEGFLVKVCAGQAIVYAYPTLKTNVQGICGTWTGLTDSYELRNGTQVAKPARGKNLPSVVGLDWEMPACLFKSRRRREASPAVSDEDQCNATSTQLQGFTDNCAASLGDLTEDTKAEFLDPCVFDQCIAVVRAQNETLAASFLTETQSMAVQAESAANDTVIYPPGQPGAPNATDHGADFVDFEWAEHEDAADANLLKYIIQRKDLTGGDWVQCGEVDGNLNQTTITDVEEGHEYIFQVIAVSEAGESEPSEPSGSILFASPYVYVPTTEAPTTVVTDSGVTTPTVTHFAKDFTMPTIPDKASSPVDDGSDL